ncbi:hypothetical protein DFP72DRAFT_908812 [Ephemerocybe angulata]|uniref:Uncharacterized protein n=1 Tax=Ephemerocybe angulata TaxID=980116 RepID=A0A8H6HPS2_9AGAR|nr:hypothetical protein DFP72DRAFT_908812 [Tulosesus angulatus]
MARYFSQYLALLVAFFFLFFRVSLVELLTVSVVSSFFPPPFVSSFFRSPFLSGARLSMAPIHIHPDVRTAVQRVLGVSMPG